MRRLGSVTLVAIVTVATIVRACLAQDPPAPVDSGSDLNKSEVRQAIDRGVAYLKGKQRPGGDWRESFSVLPEGGTTALCTLALLNSGAAADDPAIISALQKLRTYERESVYVVALQTMVFCRATPKKDGLRIKENVRWLEGCQLTGGPNKGGWRYGRNRGNGDPSNTQFALLALHEAERVGIKANDQTWRLAHNYWLKLQQPNGGWSYSSSPPSPSGSMTCAGIASLAITSGRVGGGDADVVDGQVRCCTRKSDNEAMENGIRWLERNFSVERNPGARMWHFYYVYALERVGRMTARRFIGDHDWYREGVDFLLRVQIRHPGFWKGSGMAENDPQIATSMALLFLAKGRRPVVAAKLRFGLSDDWNNHRNDLANLTFHTEQRWERDLTWQVVDSRGSTVEDLLQAPVLYLSGSKAPSLTPVQKRRLRDYLDRGGFLFAEACCDGTGFDQGFRRLMEDIFPEPEYRLKVLPPEHPIWRAEERVDPDHLKPLLGIDYGCRTSVVYCPADLSCYWELSRAGREMEYAPAVRNEIDAALAMGVNVLTYATGREPRYKDEVRTPLEERGGDDPLDRTTIRVAKLRHPGSCNAAPAALNNLLRVAEKALGASLSAPREPVPISKQTLERYHLVFMHGRNAFRFTDAEREALREYLKNGGMLMADSVCASRAFTNSFREEMRQILPEQKLTRIAADDALLTSHYGGYDIRKVTRRDPSGGEDGQPLETRERRVPPELEAITLGERYAVIFSPYDLSCALERGHAIECRGYIGEDAARIGVNIILYSLNREN